MKYQITIIGIGIAIIITLALMNKYEVMHPDTEVLKIERTQDGSEGEFNLVTKSFCYYGITQRELDSILISLATDTIK
jgi:hypothetical protein